MPPRIAITTGTAPSWEEGAWQYESYADAVRAAGGEPVRVPPEAVARLPFLLREVDGLLLSGGKDVDLRLYPNPPPLHGYSPEALMQVRAMELDLPRDHLELPLALAAVEADLPVFGICRGCQLLHVALGGQLILDLPSERPDARRHAIGPAPGDESSFHHVDITPDSRLAAAMGAHGLHETNSRHHQAVLPDTAPGIRVTATCHEDGIVEAIELPQARWVVAVQWHPERPHDPAVRDRFRHLFNAFIRACRER